MEWKNINNGEKGSSVRAKLNKALTDVIYGNEGLLTLFRSLALLKAQSDSLSDDFQVQKDAMNKSILSLMDYVNSRVYKVEKATLSNKGYFDTENSLRQVWPTAQEGNIAYVGTTFPYAIWKWTSGSWYDTGRLHEGDPLDFSGYVKTGFLNGNDTRLVDVEGNPLFPMVNSSGVFFEDGASLDDTIQGIIEDYTAKCEQLTGVFLSAEEYEALSEKDPNKLYYIYEE